MFIKRSADKQHYFVVQSGNGRTIVTSETYKRRAGALKGIRATILASIRAAKAFGIDVQAELKKIKKEK